MPQQLSELETGFFHDHGYLILRGLAPADLVEAMRCEAEVQLQQRQPPLELEVEVQYPGAPSGPLAPGGDTVRRLLQACDRHPDFRNWATGQPLAGLLTCLFDGRPPVLVQSHHNCIMTKLPHYSSETHWHRDARYWNYTSGDLISAWLALGREEAVNGGMQLIPGSHRLQLDASRFDAAQFLRTDLPENQALIQQSVLAELDPGDVLLFHAKLFHAAGRNQTERRKFALVTTYRDLDNQPQPDSRSAGLPDLPLRTAADNEDSPG